MQRRDLQGWVCALAVYVDGLYIGHPVGHPIGFLKVIRLCNLLCTALQC